MKNRSNKFCGSLKTLLLSVLICLFTCSIFAQTLAPGAPGNDAQWASAGKQGVGTSANLESKVWFTLENGALTEVYYPDVTTANVHKLEFVVVNPKTKKVETETADAIHEIKVTRPDSLTFQQINTAKSGEWKIIKTYITNPDSNSIWIDVEFQTKSNALKLYSYYDPSLKNSGMHDSAYISERQIKLVSTTTDIVSGKTTEKVISEEKNDDGGFLIASDDDVTSLLLFNVETKEATSEFLGTGDGLAQLRASGELKERYQSAKDGNVVQMERIVSPKHFTAILTFGKDVADTFKKINPKGEKLDFENVRAKYEKGWSDYVKTLPKVAPKYQAQFNMAAMQLKAHEDKTVRGANIASLTIPWGGDKNANENTVGGYHLVWSRDLYQVATAFMALGDTAAANRALDFVFNVQQKPDGSFPQNSKLDGTPFWNSLQLDEVAFPLILAYQLKRFDKATWENHVKKAADFIVKTGPKTAQERWEEKSGYSPSTIAAEIAGLVCAAEIARANNDETSANLYLKTADDWAANIEKWTATTNGKYGDGNYYIRLTENGTPDAKEKTVLNNNAGNYIENEIVDAGFLELVRLGIKSPDDPLIVKSLKVVDEQIKVDTPNGAAFYRYNHDGYGEMDDGRRWNFDGKYTGKGRLWALLSGERGQYEIALKSSKVQSPKSKVPNPQLRLDAMLGFAGDGLMIPEQIWDSPNVPKNIDKQFIPELKFGEGTGSATPLAWSMAQFIRLAVNLQAGKNLDTPDVVYNRYVLKKDDMEKTAATDCEFNVSKTVKVNDLQIKAVKSDKSPVICAENKVLFFYMGEESSVEIVGDFTSWKSTNLKFKDNFGVKSFQMNFAPNARVEYKLIVDGKWITDPLNPNRVDNGVGGENSVLTMPDYKPTVWDKDTASIGKLETVEIASKVWNESRKIQVYVPQIQGNVQLSLKKSNPLYPTLYLQDGTDYINRAKAIQVQENLVKANKIKPFIMVFVDYKDRLKEYWAADDYAKFLAAEVVPAIDKQYRTIANRDGRAILGSSLGGITSVHTALKYPEIFGRVGGQSSSFWIDEERVVKELETLRADGGRFLFYFDTGKLEGADDDRKVVELLTNKGFSVKYEEAETGHNWTSWRDRLADAFVALWRESR